MQSFSYPAVMLDDARCDGLSDPRALPVTYMVDADGIVRARFTPGDKPLTEGRLAQSVLPLLAQARAHTESQAC